MTHRNEAVRLVVHLAAVWLVGCMLTTLQLQAALVALFTDGANPFAAAVAVLILLAVAALARLGSAVRSMVPLMRRARGPWAWAAVVYALGTLGAFGTALVHFKINHLENVLLFSVSGGAWYALAAALLLPGIRVRLGALAAATALAGASAYALWAATQPPTLGEWITANEVDRTALRVGDPPQGYALHVLAASKDGFGADYERPHAVRLHLGMDRFGQDTRRVDARGCPVPFGEPIHCTDDGGGRQLVTYEGDYARQEMRLRRDGLVYTVTVEGSPADPSAARHILSTLRPASDAELAGLVELPMRRG
ncbi:hypothetical protein [Streptomyces sp. NPDC015125]|uniref:hypothetical protein n=1 Tax=Streptomyces sp. NPDC015125 TaxID=3364938 RepID=UPI0036F643EB